MEILRLTLKREYFDRIASGEKRFEYRNVKPYWTKRLKDRKFDLILFRNGYHADAPEMEVEWRGMSREGRDYKIRLGRIRKIVRWKKPKKVSS